MSTLGLRVPKLAGLSEVKRKPVAEERVEVMPGGFTCEDKPTPLITVPACLWHRVSGLICKQITISWLSNPYPYEKILHITLGDVLLVRSKSTVFNSTCGRSAGKF